MAIFSSSGRSALKKCIFAVCLLEDSFVSNCLVSKEPEGAVFEYRSIATLQTKIPDILLVYSK